MRGLYSDSAARCANAAGRFSQGLCVCAISMKTVSNFQYRSDSLVGVTVLNKRIQFPFST